MTVLQGTETPSIVPYLSKQLNYTAHDIKWIPATAKFAVVGQHPRSTGAIQIFEIRDRQLHVAAETEPHEAIKCLTFKANGVGPHRHFASGGFDGSLQSWDVDRLQTPLWSVSKAHSGIINCIDGIGGMGVSAGSPEIATGGNDGAVRVWDTRQHDRPVVNIAGGAGAQKRDCWAVAFGDSHNDTERTLCAGYDNGDLKMFDLRTMKLRWETNVKNGICGIEFDRRDIKMNKMIVTGLESAFHVFDLRTFHPESGYASLKEKAHEGTTIWTAKSLPQNREIFMTAGGNGALNLYKYAYPTARQTKEDPPKGVVGKVETLATAMVAEQPVMSFDWNDQKEGVCVYASFDQTVRVGMVTKLQSVA